VRSRTGTWIEMRAHGGALALHDAATAADGEGLLVSFVCEEPLEVVAERLRDAGFPPEGHAVDQEWGRSLFVRGPGGAVVQIDRQEPELYT